MTTDDYRGTAWTGWVIFAAAVMFTIGALDIIQGLVALLKDETYLITESGLLVTTNFTAWGWTLIIWGIVLILTAAALFAGKEWGRWVALVAVIVNLIGQIAWFPAYPLWSLVAIGLGIAVRVRADRGLEGGQGRAEGSLRARAVAVAVAGDRHGPTTFGWPASFDLDIALTRADATPGLSSSAATARASEDQLETRDWVGTD